MAERSRKIQIIFFVTPEEKEYILQKQKSANISSLSAYLRKMAIDGKVMLMVLPSIRLIKLAYMRLL